jgi:iron-regulated transporter 1
VDESNAIGSGIGLRSLDQNQDQDTFGGFPWKPLDGLQKHLLFAVALALGCAEKLSGAANMMSMERDWVPQLAAPPPAEAATGPGSARAFDLTHLNAVMRRIDLLCKLVAPMVISLIASSAQSVRIAVAAVAGMSAASWGIEVLSAKHVWKTCPRLHNRVDENDEGAFVAESEEPASSSICENLMRKTTSWIHEQTRTTAYYFSTNVWIPSLALCLLHLSVLSYSATFITYMLNIGISLNLITVARAFGSVVEVSSTLVTPWGVHVLSKAKSRNDHVQPSESEAAEGLLEPAGARTMEENIGLERLGLWGIWWQLLNLVCIALITSASNDTDDI